MTLLELVRFRVLALRAEGRSPRTISQLEQASKYFRAFLENAGELPPADGITSAHLRAFLVKLEGDRLQPETLAYYLRPLRAMFRWAREEDLLPLDPGARVKAPKVPRKVMPAPDDDHITRLLSATRATEFPLRNRAIVLLMYDTGLRASELVGIELDDADWDHQQVRVLGKGNKERVLPVGFQAMRALARYVHRERQAPAAVTALFVGRSRAPLTYNGLRLLLDRLADRADVKRMSPHKLRHGFARAFLRNGGDVFSLQRMLGHTTLEMSRRYAELTLEDVQQAQRSASPADRLRRRRS